MFVLKIFIVLLSGGVVQATHNQSFDTMMECEAFAPPEIARMGKKLEEKFPGVQITGACMPTTKPAGEPI